MDTVITLISTPSQLPLRPEDISTIEARIKEKAVHIDWLADGVAVDLFVNINVAEAQNSLQDLPFDAVCQPVEGRRKKLLLADMDATLVREESLDKLAEKVGKGQEIAALTAKAMQGEMGFSEALSARLELLRGLPEAVINEVAASLTLMSGAKTLITTMQAHGATCHLVSGGFSHFTQHVVQATGLTSARSNEFVFTGGKLIDVARPILGKEAKVTRLHELMAEYGLSSSETLAVGDGANDIPMLQAAGLGVAFHAKPKVIAAAAANIQHSDLTALLFIQGYRVAKFQRSSA
jgi:phosphoserine phosphatase